MKRVSPIAGEWIDRMRPVQFTFEGHTITAFAGDTITSALAANGLRVFGRSFKYHRPRGLLSGANHDVNAMMQVHNGQRSIPNVRADVTPVEAGWQVMPVNVTGSLDADRMAVVDRLAPFLPVGFYYKAFHSKRLFPRWERMFRKAAGLGVVDLKAPRRTTAKRYDYCDVLVIGAGPSGLAAALAAGEQGASVLLIDENRALGGSGMYARGGAEIPGSVSTLINAVQTLPRIRMLLGSYATGYYTDHWVPVAAPEAVVKVRARAVVIAQGAYEQPAVFRGNDLPGVMLASGAQRFLYRYAIAPARRVVVLTANAEGYAAARDAAQHGIEVAAVLDLRGTPGAFSRSAAEQLRASGTRVEFGVRPIEAVARGGAAVTAFEFAVGDGATATQRIEADGLWMSVGFAPAGNLLYQAGATVRYEHALEQFVPDSLPAGVYACGKVNGAYTLDDRIRDGRRAGQRAAATLGMGGASLSNERGAINECPTHAYPVFPHPSGKEIVDFDEDLQVKDIVHACQEGFDSSELLKRYSTMGMGPSQGKHSNMNALRILARVRGEHLDQHALTTARPMFHPVPLAHLAGRGFMPERRTAVDADHEALGAVWMPAGNWRRPEYYAVAGKSRTDAITSEVQAVRNGVGLIDVGTLGKIEAHGPDAAEFLERIYTARYANLKVGMTRYGLMLDEAGIVIDDGVIGRLAAEAFYFTTTTGNSATLFREFGRLATWWGLRVGLVNLTGHYSGFNIAGPRSRAVLRQLTTLDLSDAAFPYLGLREAVVADVPCRLMRVGFVGEVGYEVHTPVEHSAQLWRSLMTAGAAQQIRPFGVEAQRMLRLEKGHLIVGQDTDGVTNALEIDAPWAVRMDKPFFIGQRSLRTLQKQPRHQTLIGFTLPSAASRRPKEGHLAIDGDRIAGRVTSIGLSPTIGSVIGLALIDPTVAARGRFRIRVDGGEQIEAKVTPLPFYDPKGDRQRLEDSL
jgi:sarcosine oxidase, subunit alpha